MTKREQAILNIVQRALSTADSLPLEQRAELYADAAELLTGPAAEMARLLAFTLMQEAAHQRQFEFLITPPGETPRREGQD